MTTFTRDQRKKLASEGKALPDGSYPIRNRADLKNAISSIGRANDYYKVRKWIIKRAGQLKLKDILPESWSVK